MKIIAKKLSKKQSQNKLLINFATVANFNRNDNQFSVFKTADHAMSSDAKSPKSSHIASHLQGFSLRVGQFQNGLKKIQNTLLNCGIQFGKLTISGVVKNQMPRFIQSHGVASFGQVKILFSQSASILHRKRERQRNLLLLPATVPGLSLHKSSWCDGFWLIRQLGDFLKLRVGERPTWGHLMSNTYAFEYNMYYKFVNCFTSIAILALTACSSVSESFDSEATKGVGAKSISQVNAMIDQGKIGAVVGGVLGDLAHTQVVAPVIVQNPVAIANSETIVLSDHSVIQRQPEQHLRIWLAPFQDMQGNFHEAAVVHTLQRPSFWQVNAVP